MYIKNQNCLNFFGKIQNNPNSTHKGSANQLESSFSKLNYFIKALIEICFIKISDFKKNSNKKKNFYIFTLKGALIKIKLILNFKKRIKLEYDELKKNRKLIL